MVWDKWIGDIEKDVSGRKICKSGRYRRAFADFLLSGKWPVQVSNRQDQSAGTKVYNSLSYSGSPLCLNG